jgi:hypothetical protein
MPKINKMEKTQLPPAMYHGANSFAKEYYRETTDAGCGCTGAIPDNRDSSEHGGWKPDVSLERLPAQQLDCRK